jgi:hypothetical protein
MVLEMLLLPRVPPQQLCQVLLVLLSFKVMVLLSCLALLLGMLLLPLGRVPLLLCRRGAPPSARVRRAPPSPLPGAAVNFSRFWRPSGN